LQLLFILSSSKKKSNPISSAWSRGKSAVKKGYEALRNLPLARSPRTSLDSVNPSSPKRPRVRTGTAYTLDEIKTLQYYIRGIKRVMDGYGKRGGGDLKSLAGVLTLIRSVDVESGIGGKSLATSIRDEMPNVFMMLKLFMVLPVTTATAERSFSQLRRLKDYLRNSMGDRNLQLNGMMVIHKELVRSLSNEQIADIFVSRRNNKRNIFGPPSKLVQSNRCRISKISVYSTGLRC
jgi:hypothetical protein